MIDISTLQADLNSWLWLSVHTLRNLISQDETPTASTTPQKSMLSLSDNHFLSVLKFHLLLNYTILVQLLALSPCYHPSEARPERRSLDNVNMFNIYGEEATSFSCFCTFGLWNFVDFMFLQFLLRNQKWHLAMFWTIDFCTFVINSCALMVNCFCKLLFLSSSELINYDMVIKYYRSILRW